MTRKKSLKNHNTIDAKLYPEHFFEKKDEIWFAFPTKESGEEGVSYPHNVYTVKNL